MSLQVPGILGDWGSSGWLGERNVDRCVWCNTLSRSFARYNGTVKITVFKLFCQTFYTCSLWKNYTKKALVAPHIQYNIGFGMLLGMPRLYSAGMWPEPSMLYRYTKGLRPWPVACGMVPGLKPIGSIRIWCTWHQEEFIVMFFEQFFF